MGFQLPLAVAGIFVSVGMLTGAIAWAMLDRTSVERRRLQQVAGVGGGGAANLLLDESSLVQAPTTRIKGLPSFVPKSPEKMGALRKRLGRAGYYTLSAAVTFSLIQALAPIVLGLAALVVFGVTRGWLIALGVAGIGYMLPGIVLSRLIKKRQKAISNGLPDVLDLLIVCLEAGSGLDQGMAKAGEDLAIAHPELAEEIRLTLTEMRAGKPRLDAFRNFAARTGENDVRSLVAMLVQTDRFGTSIAQALRVHAATSRTKRRQRAEERAAKVSVKLVFPLVFCLMPAFYVVTLGPAFLDFIKFFSQIK